MLKWGTPSRKAPLSPRRSAICSGWAAEGPDDEQHASPRPSFAPETFRYKQSSGPCIIEQNRCRLSSKRAAGWHRLMVVDSSFRGGSVPVFPDMNGSLVTSDIRKTNGTYLTPQHFIAPEFGQPGTLARNAFHGPGVNNLELGTLKNFAIKERLHAQLRADQCLQPCSVCIRRSKPRFSNSAAGFRATLPSMQYVDPSQFGRAMARAPRIVQLL